MRHHSPDGDAPTGLRARSAAALLVLTLAAGCDGAWPSGPAGPQVLAIATRLLPPALHGAPYRVRLAASGPDAVEWRHAGGTLPPGLLLSADGRIEGTPTEQGAYRLTVEAVAGGDLERASFDLFVAPNRTDRFDIQVLALGDLPVQLTAHLEAAAARWEDVISGDLPTAVIPPDFFRDGECFGDGTMLNGTSVDDLLVVVVVDSIDGPWGALGQAGPCALREEGLPFAAHVEIDADDWARYSTGRGLTDLFVHEIGHALGFGPLWATNGLVQGSGGADPRFIGAESTREFAALGGAGRVPLENTGGERSAEKHWREAVFDTEVMTSLFEGLGSAQPLSRLTIASLMDLGYEVRLDAAESFTGDGVLQDPPHAPAPHPVWDLVPDRPIRVLPRR